jgi:hypothetical protein
MISPIRKTMKNRSLAGIHPVLSKTESVVIGVEGAKTDRNGLHNEKDSFLQHTGKISRTGLQSV